MEVYAILNKLEELKRKIDEQSLLTKEVLNFTEACRYLDLSPSHVYKLTSGRKIPHFCPQGKRLYFNREELNEWLQRNRQSTQEEVDSRATNFMVSKDKKG